MHFFQSLLPLADELGALLLCALLFAGALMLFGLIIRLVLGKNSGLNRALSSALGILAIYAAALVLPAAIPGASIPGLSALPLVTCGNGTIRFFSLRGVPFPALSRELMGMVLLVFISNLLTQLLPQGKKPLSWLFWRSISVVAAIAAHGCVRFLLRLVVPGLLEGYGPMIALSILLFMLLLGVLKLILGLVVTALNPIFGAVYAFFFAHKTGKQLSTAVLTTALLCLFLRLLEHFGVTVISLAGLSWWALVPLTGAFVLWYILDCKL